MKYRLLHIASLAFLPAPALIAAAQHPAATPRQDFTQLLQSAENSRESGRDDDAIQLFRRALSQQPDSEEALWYLGTLLYEKEQYADARDVLRQFMTLRGDAAPGWALLGLCEFQLREYPHALDHLQRAMKQGIGDRRDLARPVLYDLVVLLTRFERYDESQALFAFTEPDPSLIEPAGLAGLRLPLLPAEIPPDRRELVDLAGTAVMALQGERDDEAKSAFKRLLAAYPNEPGVHFLYGAYVARQHPDEAVPEFEREMQISPFHVLARVRLAEQFIARREFDPALEFAREAIQLDPKRPSAHAFAGEALIGKGNAAEGIKELETAEERDPTVSRVHWDLMRAYAAAGRKEEAKREQQEMKKLLDAEGSNASPASSTQDSSAK
ncbi:tetratricopeptide repeat protein [Acidobacteria bacterium AB60]|nr:tetratricopeptide repeat protein [Acidobacteria bacterium AB60]